MLNELGDFLASYWWIVPIAVVGLLILANKRAPIIGEEDDEGDWIYQSEDPSESSMHFPSGKPVKLGDRWFNAKRGVLWCADKIYTNGIRWVEVSRFPVSSGVRIVTASPDARLLHYPDGTPCIIGEVVSTIGTNGLLYVLADVAGNKAKWDMVSKMPDNTKEIEALERACDVKPKDSMLAKEPSLIELIEEDVKMQLEVAAVMEEAAQICDSSRSYKATWQDIVSSDPNRIYLKIQMTITERGAIRKPTPKEAISKINSYGFNRLKGKDVVFYFTDTEYVIWKPDADNYTLMVERILSMCYHAGHSGKFAYHDFVVVAEGRMKPSTARRMVTESSWPIIFVTPSMQMIYCSPGSNGWRAAEAEYHRKTSPLNNGGCSSHDYIARRKNRKFKTQ